MVVAAMEVVEGEAAVAAAFFEGKSGEGVC